MRLILALAAAMAAPAAAWAADAPLQIGFCPGHAIHAFPLESRRKIESVVLQDVVVANRTAAAVSVTGVDLDILQAGRLVETRRIEGDELAHAAAMGADLQTGGVIKEVPFVFCGGRVVPPGVTLAGPTLAPGQGLLLFQQLLSFQGVRDAIRVVVHARAGDHDVATSAEIPIVSGLSKTVFQFPLKGAWYVETGPTPFSAHRWAAMEEFALDLGKLGDGGLDHAGDGQKFSDYYGYGAAVMAAADGRVVAAVDGVAEDASAMRRPDEDMPTYMKRQAGIEGALTARGIQTLAGNYVVIDHGDGEFSLYAHMKPGSVRVKVGEVVKVGQPVGQLGSSGNSTAPHLHFQVCDGPDPVDCAGIPINFKDIELPLGDFPRPVQSGDVVVAK